MDFTFQVIKNIREIFIKIIEDNALEDLNKIPEGFNNNIIWNIAHVVISEQLLAYRLSGLKIDIPEPLINAYKKDSKPEKPINKEELEIIKGLLASTIAKTKTDYDNGIFKEYNSYTVSTTGNTLNSIDDALQFIMTHDGLHYGYVLALLKAIKS